MTGRDGTGDGGRRLVRNFQFVHQPVQERERFVERDELDARGCGESVVVSVGPLHHLRVTECGASDGDSAGRSLLQQETGDQAAV